MRFASSVLTAAARIATALSRPRILVVLPLFLLGMPQEEPGAAPDEIVSANHFVTHRSTVPANNDEIVGLFVRERFAGPTPFGRPVVLMVHGSPISSTPAFDLPFEDYSGMAALARAGFDVFAVDLTGYGLSPRPMLADPCNASPTDQALLGITPCAARYPFRLGTSQSEWDEIDSVVDRIRQWRRVQKVNLIGWSLGGPRAGGYAALHPEKVDRLVLYAPVYSRLEPNDPPGDLPQPGVPLSIRPTTFTNWNLQIGCSDQFAPEVRPEIVAEVLRVDPLVAKTWGTPGFYRAPVLNQRWGWNAQSAGAIQASTMIIRGALDTQVPEAGSRDLYADLGSEHKVFVRVECASHFMLWERQRAALWRAAAEWIRHGEFAGQRDGSFFVTTGGDVRVE